MKSFLKYFFALLAFVVGLALANDGLNVYLMRNAVGNSAGKMARLWGNPCPEEVTVFGSSRALGHFVPSILGTNCFNYGENGMGVPEVLFLLETASRRRTDIPVIVNLDPWGFGGFAHPRFVGDYRLAPQSGRLAWKEKLWGVRFYGCLRQSFTMWLNERTATTKVIESGAVIPRQSRTPEEWKVMNAKQKPWRFARDDAGERRFEEQLKALAPRQVYVVVGPCCSRFTELYPDADSLRNYLARLAQLTNVRILNLFETEAFTDLDFFDPLHLNYQGACKFSKMVRQVMVD